MNHQPTGYITKTIFFLAAICTLAVHKSQAQAELMPYGNLNGIRVQGQLMDFNTSIDVVGNSWHKINATAKERQRPKFKRDGDVETVNTAIDSLVFTETVTDIGKGKIKINITCNVRRDTSIIGVYLGLRLPKAVYAASQVTLKDQAMATEVLKDDMPTVTAKGITFKSPVQHFSISTNEAALIIRPQSDDLKYIQLYFPICEGTLKKGDLFEKTFEIKVEGDIDNTDATILLDAAAQGREFAGLGGNFRLQNAKTDPQVIDYCLKNLRVAWGRVEMPWRDWQPDMNTDPIAMADSSNLNNHVRQSMEMAQRLGQMNMLVVLTAWAPPQWAVVGKLKYRPTPDGVWGNPLNNDNTQQIYKSITDYIIYLKNHYGVEVTYFSFNESDLGINIRQTGQEHLALIKGLGKYFADKGLKTKLLLGDNSDATTYKFIYPAMNDPEARPYIGAVSFHSWRGWDTPTLQKWADAAAKLNLPLLVGEGSIDAAAWEYPAYFEEQSYALEEINLYTRLLAICQPLSILQWQLTADYSPLSGGGIFGNDGPLKPTQRFWQLKQLASTPAGLKALAVTVDKPAISCAALGDAGKHKYVIHLVNNSAARKVYLKGLPASVTRLKVYVTDKDHNVSQKGDIKVINNQAAFKLSARCFTTLESE
ncbi:glycoside hydrolase [Mucilaginibacter ginsenosidivorax]|uniref:Uncharacterized protein n=1 Tax=Mucilaginibacter ginsenosidivorax TaxID=862126 RepID=A0A5B8W2S4_9SPHI|nr:hypothetical protein [Mucilaginibacter ginsenosidivorax]QEC76618.1 hypothetical protein FSB76_11900 [Mucilaginibacter ginsenosidivorax]